MPMFAGGVAFVPIEPEEHSEDEPQVQPAMGLQMQSAISHQMQPHEEYHAQPHMQLQMPPQMQYPMQAQMQPPMRPPMQPQLQEQYPQMYASHYEHQQQQLFHDFDFQAAQQVHAQHQSGPVMEGVPPAWTDDTLVDPAANAPEAYADMAQTGLIWDPGNWEPSDVYGQEADQNQAMERRYSSFAFDNWEERRLSDGAGMLY